MKSKVLRISTATTAAPLVNLNTPVSIQVGTDQYAAKVVSVTEASVLVSCPSLIAEYTFRPCICGKYANGEVITGWRTGSLKRGFRDLVLGESITRLDIEF